MRVSRPSNFFRRAIATTDDVITCLLSFLDETEAELATLTASLACAPISLRVLDPIKNSAFVREIARALPGTCSGVRLSFGLWM